MKENEFLDGVSNIDADVIERFVNMDNKLQSKSKRSKGVFLRVFVLAASIALVIGVIAVVMLHNGEKTEAKEVEHFLVFFASGDASATLFDEA